MNDDDLKLALDDLLRPLPALGALPERTAVRVRRRRATRLAGLGTAAVLVVAGGLAVVLPGGGPDRVTPAPFASPGPSAAPSASPLPPPPPVASVARVVLQGEGLALASGSSTRLLGFADTDATTVRAALDRALGDSTENANDCGAVVVQYDGLVVALRGAAFVGWSVPQTGRLTTADGLGTGTTLAELRAARADVEVRQGLGTEWSSGALAGFLDGTAATSEVTGLYAGDVCLAR